MVFMSVGSGSQAVHVRVDDLDPAERAQVAKTIAGVRKIVEGGDLPVLFGLIAGVVGWIVTLGILASVITGEVSFLAFLLFFALSVADGFAIGWLAHRGLRPYIHARQTADAAVLQQCVTQSPRAREFIAAYIQHTPGIGKILAPLVPLPAAAATA
ncbi:hypothetical protein HY480_00420 [Candidatus Uhrbacteria bacterium]|nr:hypothetical protein [Candidatus Uhrbacteria bacterium]